MFSLLYIDDEPGLLELGQLFLERTGEFTVTTALSAETGLACLAQREFDAIISDYQMPGMDGISLLKNVRKSHGNIPFVLFTGRGREEVVIEAINNGVDFYLQKGGDPKAQFAELAHKVRQAVNRRNAETALSDSEKRLADIINFLPDATFAIDMQGVVIAWNRAMEQMTGVSSAEILGKGNFEYAIPFYRERRPLLINLVLDEDPALTAKYPFVKKEGKTLFSEITIPHFNDGRGAALWFTASPLYNRNGDVVGAIESIREITERKQAEENLFSANREYTNLLDQIQDVYYRSDTEGRLVKASRSWATLFGYDDISECLGRSIADDFYINPSDRKLLLDEIYRNGKVSGYEVMLKKKDGTPVLVEASSHLNFDSTGTIIGIEGTFRDITERKKSEKDLHSAYEQIASNEEKFRSIVETTPDIIWECDLQGKFRYISPRVAAIMGYQPEEIVGRSIIDLVPDEVKPFIIQELPRYASLKESPLPLEVPARHRDGRELILEIRPALAGTSVNPLGFRGVAVDITERKRAEKALKTSEKRFRELAELLPQGIYEADANGTLTYANPRALEMFRHTEEDIKKGLNIRSTIAHKDRQRVETAFGQIAEQRIQPIKSMEYLALRKDGTTFPIAIFSSPITRDGRVTGVRGILIDISERKAAEDALSESERRFRELADLLPQGIYEADITGRLTYANRLALEMSGYTHEDLRNGINAMTVFAPEDRQRAAAVFSRMVEQGTRSEGNTEYKAQRKDGSTFPVSIFSSPVIRDGRIVGVRGVIMDITERKQAEEELRAVNEQLLASEEELRSQYDELADSEKRIRMSETRLTFMLGFYEYSQKSEKELLEYAIEGAGIVSGSPLGYLAFLNEDESQLSMYAWSKTAMAECTMQEKPIIYQTEKTGLWGEAVRQRRPVITNDYAAPNPAKKGYPEGHPRIIRHMNVPVLDEGRIVLVAGVANKPSDYTEKDASELLLLMQGLWTIIKRRRVEESQKLLKISVDQSADEIFWMDFDGKILYVNEAACRINGYSRDEFLKMKIYDLNPDLTPAIWVGSVTDLRAKKAQLFTTRHRHRNGTVIDVEIMAVYVNHDGKEYSFAFVRDITDRKRSDSELQAAYGQLLASEEELRSQLDEIIKAQEEQKRTEKNFRILVDNAPDAIYIQTNTRFRYLNNAALKLLGAWSADELLGTSMWDRIHPSFHERIRGRVKNLTVDLQPVELLEEVYVKLDGTPVDVEVKAVPFQYEGEHGVLVMLRDISARKRAEADLHTAYEQLSATEEELRGQYEELACAQAELQKHQQQLEEITGTVPGVVYQFYARPDGKMGLYYVSDRAEEILGISRNTDDFFERFTLHLDQRDREAFLDSVNDAVSSKTPWDFTGRFKKPTGETIWIRGISRPFVREMEIVFSGFILDVSDRKKAEELLSSRQTLLDGILQSTDDGILVISDKGKVLATNRRFKELWRIPENLFTTESDEALLAFVLDQLEEPDEFLTEVQRLYGTDEESWSTIRFRDGRFFERYSKAILLEGCRNRLWSFRDITKRMRAETALQQANLVVENSPVVIFRWEAKEGWPVAFVSRNVTQFGYTPAELMSGTVPYSTIVHPDDLERVTLEVQRYSSEGPDEYQQEYRIITRNGNVRWIDDRTVIERDPEGRITHYQGIIIDITERKRAEEALRERERDYRGVIDNLQDVFYRADAAGNITMASHSVVDVFGYSSIDEVIGLNLGRDIYANPEDRKRFLTAISQTGSVKNFEAVLKKKDGSPIIVSTSAHYYRDKDGTVLGVEGIAKDITEWKHDQRALIDSEEKFRHLITSAPLAMGLLTSKGEIEFINNRFTDLFGYSHADVSTLKDWIEQAYPDAEYRKQALETWDAAVRKGLENQADIEPIEYNVTCKDGSVRNVIISGIAIDEKLLTTFIDVSEQRKAEDALRESEEKYRNLAENTGDILFSLDTGGIIKYVSPQISGLGYSPEELTGTNFLPLIHPEDREAVSTRFKSEMVSGDNVNSTFRLLDRSGAYHWVEERSNILFDDQHRPIGLNGIVRDIDDRKQAEDALRESSRKYAELFDLGSEAIFLIDNETGALLETNSAACEMYGYPRDILLTMKNTDLSAEQEETRKITAETPQGIVRVPLRYHQRRDGTVFPVEIIGRFFIWNGRPVHIAAIRDITEQKRAEAALVESEEKYRTLVEVNRDIIYSLSIDGTVLYVSPQITAQLGYMPDEVGGHNFSEIVHPEDVGTLVRHVQENFTSGKPLTQDQFRLRRKDGTYRWYEDKSIYATDRRGRHIVSGTIRDITEEKSAQDALRESEEKFRALVETTSDFIWEVDTAGVYTYVSPQVYQILGYEPEEMVGRTPFDFMLPEEIEKVTAEFNHCIASRLPIVALENKAMRKDGSVVVLETSGVVRTANDGMYLGYRGIDRDITTRKEAAERTTRLSALKQDLLRTAPLEEKLKQITDGIVDIFGADFARIWMTGPGDLCDVGCIHAAVTRGSHVCRNRKSCLHLIASSGRYTHTDGNHRRVPFGAYKIGRLATGEEALFITNDVTHDPRVHDHAWAESLGLVSFSGFQLVSPEGDPIGVLAFFSREPVTQDIVDDLDDLATTTSQVIQTGMAEEVQQEREEWARTILNTAQTGIVLIDAETHRILDANPKALGMIGLPRNSVIGRVCHYFICPAEKGNCPVTDGGQDVDSSERILVTAAETMIPVLKTVVSVSLGGKKVLVESFVDISEQKRSEAAIREANRKLNLLSSITRHDVANQLTIIQGYTQLAALSKPEPVIADFLAKIESGIDIIQRQIEFTRTYQDLGVQAPSWFVIGDVVRSVRHEGVRLVCTCKSYEIYADPMIDRVFFNLFDNAVRYGERVTTVRVGCAKKGKKLVIRFADNGVGIPPVEKKKVFLKGYGKHTGFGLFLAREILAITGITIQETGTFGKGAVFEITVPEGSFRKAD